MALPHPFNTISSQPEYEVLTIDQAIPILWNMRHADSMQRYMKALNAKGIYLVRKKKV